METSSLINNNDRNNKLRINENNNDNVINISEDKNSLPKITLNNINLKLEKYKSE